MLSTIKRARLRSTYSYRCIPKIEISLLKTKYGYLLMFKHVWVFEVSFEGKDSNHNSNGGKFCLLYERNACAGATLIKTIRQRENRSQANLFTESLRTSLGDEKCYERL